MRTVRTGALLAAGVLVGRTVVRKVAARRGSGDGNGDGGGSRWLAVTINAPFERVEESKIGEALAGMDVETRLAPAPGGRGTEVAARLRQAPDGVLPRLTGTDPRQAVRRALRDLKSTLETGEVIRPDEPTTGKPTPGGALVRLATRRASGEGRL